MLKTILYIFLDIKSIVLEQLNVIVDNQQIFTLYHGEMTKDGDIINAKEFVSSDRFVFNSSSAGFSADGKHMYATTNEKKRGDVYKYER